MNKDKLKQALEIVKPGLANKEIIEQTTSFAFMNGRVVTYNDEISISHPIEGLEIEGAILAEELYKYLSKVKTEEISVSLKENELILKAGKAITGFSLISKIVLPVEEQLSKKGKWFELPEKFLEFLKFASMSCSSDMSNPKLTCVHINSNGSIEGCDNFRIAHCVLKEELKIESTLIPASSVDVIVRNNPAFVSKGVGWIHFKNENGTIISCRTIEETYNDTSVYLNPSKKGGIQISLPKNLTEILDKAIIFSKKEQKADESVEIHIGNNLIEISSSTDHSWFREKTKIDYNGKEISFSIMPNLLKDIMSYTKDCMLIKNLLYFKGENWIYLTSLLSIN